MSTAVSRGEASHNALENELVTDGNTEDVVSTISLESLLNGVALPHVCCAAVCRDVVVSEVHRYVDLCSVNSLQLELENEYKCLSCPTTKELDLQQGQTGCSPLRTDGYAVKPINNCSVTMKKKVTYRGEL